MSEMRRVFPFPSSVPSSLPASLSVLVLFWRSLTPLTPFRGSSKVTRETPPRDLKSSKKRGETHR